MKKRMKNLSQIMWSGDLIVWHSNCVIHTRMYKSEHIQEVCVVLKY
jgi:hypothetical protein